MHGVRNGLSTERDAGLAVSTNGPTHIGACARRLGDAIAQQTSTAPLYVLLDGWR